MLCSEFLKDFERWMDGERTPASAVHLEECAKCRQLTAELGAIALAGVRLAEEIPEPPERVWTALRAQLVSEGIIQQRGWREWWAERSATFPRPALAGAYAAVILCAVVLSRVPTAPVQEPVALGGLQSPVVALQPQFGRVEQKQVASVHGRNPAVIAKCREGLEIVDNFIALCEKTVREDPRNQVAREYLYSAYQQKAELLATMTEQGTGGTR